MAFGGRLELRLNDVYDSQFGRKVMEQIPKEISGRGAMEGERIFQAAVPRIDGVRETEDVFEAQKALFTAITKRWEGIADELVDAELAEHLVADGDRFRVESLGT